MWSVANEYMTYIEREMADSAGVMDVVAIDTPRERTLASWTLAGAISMLAGDILVAGMTARATAGKVLASRCARQGQSTRRGMISPHMKCSTSTTWCLVRDTRSSSSSSCQRGYQPRPSRPGCPPCPRLLG
eukprot:scaffold47449_cov110-Phaeocystis_antarctica.AAC.1